MTGKPTTQRNRLRIIGGEWRSRLLNFADIPDLRPTPDRVRETLFNWLQETIAGARCLDLFAGSGALGFEALSRGAREVVALELDGKAVAAIRQNAKLLQTEGMQLVQKNVLEWLQHNAEAQRFDVVFLDPPYSAGLYESCLRLLHEHGWLAPRAYVYLEADEDLERLKLPAGWELIRSKRAGGVYYGMCRAA